MSQTQENQARARLELLYHVSRELATALDLRTVLQRVLYEAIQNVGGERCSIVVLDDAGKAVRELRPKEGAREIAKGTAGIAGRKSN